MMKGKVSAVVELLAKISAHAIIVLTRSLLIANCQRLYNTKRRDAKSAHPGPLLRETNAAQNSSHPILFDSITTEIIGSSALYTKRFTGPL